ncbi:glycosyltransferase family 61 protein [Aeromicrobium piscarium]|uniref:Glycosyltransferase family 61 protein n=1 Tax=Aeromicrobium piscarium TaxID=2590901 RepID=A0A554S7M2_9ACTN|nr:glycosyltransferase 61 family protein [Aeromicrobium piscarium]TSD62350.1 glycosyltransferase family 61 protein [Aeromicrobium piscarium]
MSVDDESICAETEALTTAALVEELRAALPASTRPPVVAALGDDVEGLTEALAETIPDAVIHHIDLNGTNDQIHTRLARWSRYDAIVDLSRDAKGRPVRFRNTFSHLRAGGVWMVADLRPGDADDDARAAESYFGPYLAKLLDYRHRERPRASWQDRDVANMAEVVGRIVWGERHVLVTNRFEVLAKMREEQTNDLLREGASFGRLLHSEEPETLHSRARVFTNDPVALAEYREVSTTPATAIRMYEGVRCAAGGAVIAEGRLLQPESFRHNQYPRLTHRLAPSRTHYFADKPQADHRGRLDGTYLYLDGEYTSHFGHFVSEQMSRLWALPWIRDHYRDVKVLLSHRPDRGRPSEWEYALLEAAGVDRDDVVSMARGTSYDVERLIGVTPLYSMPDYLHPRIVEVWSTIAEGLQSRASERDYPDRVFLTRAPDAIRPCHNAEVVESRFERAGFTLLRPEELPLPDQAALFRRASVIAGYEGSALLGLAYCERPKIVITIGQDAYVANNEQMVSSVRGHTLVQVVSEADVSHPSGGWSWDAFYSGFSFDEEREGLYLDHVLAQLDSSDPDFEVPEPSPQGTERVVRWAVRTVKPRVSPRTWRRVRRLARRR